MKAVILKYIRYSALFFACVLSYLGLSHVADLLYQSYCNSEHPGQAVGRILKEWLWVTWIDSTLELPGNWKVLTHYTGIQEIVCVMLAWNPCWLTRPDHVQPPPARGTIGYYHAVDSPPPWVDPPDCLGQLYLVPLRHGWSPLYWILSLCFLPWR